MVVCARGGYKGRRITLIQVGHDVRLMACSYAVTTHVVAIIRHGRWWVAASPSGSTV